MTSDWLPPFRDLPAESLPVCSSLDLTHTHAWWTIIINNLLLFFLPRYSVPEDLEIKNKEKKNYNGCNGLAGSERALKWDRVPPLQCCGHLLEQVGGLSVVAFDVCRPSYYYYYCYYYYRYYYYYYFRISVIIIIKCTYLSDTVTGNASGALNIVNKVPGYNI